ncbi:MAG: S49 family peptidase [Prevotellaceae bacterium]|jgi:ClpP class serine protease|nr:S49 family peptidase [Prevotellaceae bacterium]
MDKFIQLLSTPIACEVNAQNALLASIMLSLRNGTTTEFEKALSMQVHCRVYAINAASIDINIASRYELDDENLPEQSVAVLFLEGIIYPYKVFDMENMLQRIAANPKIIGTLIFVNTPGGYVYRLNSLHDEILNSAKPVFAYVSRICFSAGMWIVSGARRIFMDDATDQIGSIGTMTTFISLKKMFEELGITQKDIYATLSTRKNEDVRAIEQNLENDELIIKDLDFLNSQFHEVVAKALGLDTEQHLDEKTGVFEGAVFFRDEAIRLGLAHEKATFQQALNSVMKEGLKVQALNI